MIHKERFTITIKAVSGEPRNYAVQVEGARIFTRQYTVGPHNSIGNLVARLCNQLEIDLAGDFPDE